MKGLVRHGFLPLQHRNTLELSRLNIDIYLFTFFSDTLLPLCHRYMYAYCFFFLEYGITYDIASVDYNLDICRFVEITPKCKTDYVITAVRIQRLPPGNCGCFRQDMEVALYEKCIGTASCTLSFSELKVDTTVYPHPPTEFCWFSYRIIYTCEPGKNTTICTERYTLQTPEKLA